MLTPDYLWYVPEKAEKQAEELHNKIVSVMIERMMIRLGRGEDYLFTPIDKWQMDVLQDAGYILQYILLTSGKWMYCRMQGISCKRYRKRLHKQQR